MAAISDRGFSCFITYPQAPARVTRSAHSPSSCIDSTSTRTAG